MRLRRKTVMIAAIAAAGVVLLIGIVGICSAGFRYLRYRSCRGTVSAAGEAAEALADERLRADVAAHVDYLRQRVGKGWLYSKRDVFLGRLLAECRSVRDAASGRMKEPHLAPGRGLEPGHHVIVTESRVDGARMPTSVTVPRGWDGKLALPLVLHLHSGGVTEMLHCFPAPAVRGALSVMPLARGSHDYLGVQMTAVEECVDEVRRRYPLSGTYVMGASQGGMGSWLYAERHAMEVSGVSPWCGNADPAAWQGVWERPREEPASPAGRAARLYRASRSPVARVEQLVTSPAIPVYVAHGTADAKIPIGHSGSMHEKLVVAGARPRYDRLEGHGHRLPPMYDERFAWLSARSPEIAVARKKMAYRYPGVIPPLTFVAELEGAPPLRVLDPLAPARFTLEGDRDRPLEEENCGCEPCEGPSKWHYPGPAGAAFDHPFSIALPKDAPAHLTRCAADFAALWRKRYGAGPRRSDAAEGISVFGPREGYEKERRTLVALGSPEENPLVREALAGLDVEVGRGRARLFAETEGGRELELEGDDVALVMLRPRLDDPYAATLVVWGSTPASYRQLWTRFGQAVDWEGERGRWWFDYAVFDRRTAGPETFLAVGCFDHDWRVDRKLLFEGSSKLRAATPGTHWPACAGDATRPRFGRVWLSSLAPIETDLLRGPVGFDRSAGVDAGALTIHGRRFERGIGMVPPAAATWRLGGRYARLGVEVGLEREAAEFAVRHEAERVRFEVRGDGRLLAESDALSSTDAPAALDADLTGVDELTLRAVPATRHVWHFGPVGWGGAELVPLE